LLLTIRIIGYNVNKQKQLLWLAMTDREQINVLDDGLLVLAPAKINLSLLVDGLRADGYHEIETIIAKVDLFDEIFIEPGTRSGLELVCTGAYPAPQGKANSICRACELLLKESSSKANLKITLTKNIPAGSGLGSASSDAAATLLGVNRLLKLGIGSEHLSELAAQLGSDVPFFLNGPLAFCSGRGEKIKKLEQDFNFLALLILPDVTVSTKRVYTNYRENRRFYELLKTQINSHIDKNRIDLAAAMCANMLESACFSLYEELAELKEKIESSVLGPWCLSGSGSAFFSIVEGRNTAIFMKEKLEEVIGCKSVIVSSIGW